MCYAPLNGIHETFPQYKKYNIPIVLKNNIPNDSLIVLPEILPEMYKDFSQKVSLWWLSVDNFVKDNLNILNNFSLHMTQSKYAKQFLNTNNLSSIMLTDYINDIFSPEITKLKASRVCVNPSKGAHLINEFKNMNNNISVLELSQMSRETIKNYLDESMVYVDFGHHPGRDRFPREAALSGAVVLTTKCGAAENDVDIPIDSWYKFSDLNELSLKVNDVLNNFNYHQDAQKSYRQIVMSQKNIFKSEVELLLQKAWSLYNE